MTAQSYPGGIFMFQYGTVQIEYEVIFSARKTIAISVFPDGAVIVKAPSVAQQPEIEHYVSRRAAWIQKQRRHFSALNRPHAPRREYVSGEAYRFLGRQYRLKVRESPVERVSRSRTLIIVESRTPEDGQAVGAQLENWFEAQARRVFYERLDECYRRVAHWKVDKPRLSVRPMKLRWGSLTAKGTLTLHSTLIQAPTEIIDYVILHELCHLREMNHGAAFYSLLSQVLPNWRELRRRLNTYDFI